MRLLTTLCLIAITLLVVMSDAVVQGAEPVQAQPSLQVLILHSYSQEYPWTRMENDGFVATLQRAFPDRTISFATEYLDTKRKRYSSDYRLFFTDYLHEKFRGFVPDLIYVTDDDAYNFLKYHGRELFPESPVVFSGINDAGAVAGDDRSWSTGVFENKDIGASIELVERLFPAIETIDVVGDGSTTYRAIRDDIVRYMSVVPTAPRPATRFTASEQLTDVIQKLGDRQTELVLLTTIGGFRDAGGQMVPIRAAIEAIRGAGDFVILSMEDVYLREGVLGGVVSSGRAQGEVAAATAIRILSEGAAPGEIPVVQGPNIPTFNYLELKRRGINESQLPDGAKILHKPLSLYDEFKAIFWSIMVVFLSLVTMLIVLSFNIIRRRAAEEALAESERFLNSVIEHLPDMIFVKDAESLRFVRLNRASEQLIGIPREEMLGRSDYDLFPEQQADFFTAKDREVLELGEQLVIPEESIQTHTGVRYLHTQKIPINDQQGEPRYLLGISRDITREKADRKRRRELEMRLRQAEKMESIGTLAGGIAHDFNNILSSIIGYTELAQLETADPDKRQTFLAGALRGAIRAKELTRQILTFSRKSEPQKTPIDPAEIVGDALQFLRSSLPTTISITSQLTAGTTIEADPTQLHQIILNLCTNGYHAMLESGGTLAVTLKRIVVPAGPGHFPATMTAGAYVRLAVSDTGCGMDVETRQRMFEPYFTTKGSEGGTGLGLAVVHGIVKNHNGHIHVYSEPEEGTTIHVYFPEVSATGADQEANGESELVRGGDESILLVDDEQDLRQMTSALLSRFGYRVTTCASGEEAVAELATKHSAIDLVVTDMTMPGMTGAELAHHICQSYPTLPVILCTGHSEIINREKALAMGVAEYCEKPLTMEQLLLCVRRVLDRASSHG